MTLTRFADLVHLNTDRIADPAAAGIERYVGLEHIEPENLHIRSWGLVAEGTTFTNHFKPGQVLFGKRRAYQRKVAVADFEGVCSGDIYVFESKDPDKLLPELLPFICQSEGFYEYAVKTSAGSLSPRTNWKHLAEYEFPFPPIDEQRCIADLFWAADDVISQYQDVLLKLESLNIRFTEKLFSKGIENSETTQTEIGDIPVHWKLEQLQRVTTTVNNGFVGKAAKHYVNQGIPYLLGKNVRENRLDLSELTYISQEFHETSVRSQLKVGDMLTVQSGHVGVSCVVPPELDGANCHAVIISRPKKDVVNSHFLAQYFNSPIGRRRLSSLHIGTTIPHINTSDLRKFKVPIPPLSEQQNIVDMCEAVNQSFTNIQNRLENTQNLKRQLLEKFLGN
jgi:type I restriction enzyme S subunit